MRICFAWWGTGGHVFPIQSLITYIDATHPGKHDLFWFGESRSLEQSVALKLISQWHKIRFHKIVSGKWRREKEFVAILKNILGIGKVLFGTLQSLYYIQQEKIDIVFCKWWYVSLPVVLAARILRKKVILHESDTKPWIANRICARFTDTIFTAFTGVFPGREEIVWQILSADLLPTEPVVDPINTHVLVSGWSQWAQSMYHALLSVLKQNDLSATMFHIVLWTKNAWFKDVFRDFTNVRTYDFVSQEEMWELLALCDLAITRGGTTSLGEQQMLWLKKIIIPIPRTHDQYTNANYYKKHYNDILVPQDANFQYHLWQALLQNCSYKKPALAGDIAEQIEAPKKTILAKIESYSSTK